MRPLSRVPHLLGLFAMLVGALALPMATTAQTPTCADYSSTAAAQFALDINPSLAPSLDPDGNGVACDDAASAAQTPSSTELQLPTGAAETPAATTGQPQPTADVIDGQPTQSTTTQTQPQTGDLDGRIGGSRAQRDLVENTLLAAYLKAGRPDDARRLVAAHGDRRPTVPVAGL